MDALPACVSVYHVHVCLPYACLLPKEAKESVRFPGTVVTDARL